MEISVTGRRIMDIDSNELKTFQPYVFPSFLTPDDKPESLLDWKNSDLFAVQAFVDGVFSGLLIGDFKEVIGTATIKSLFGTCNEVLLRLLAFFEEESRRRKISKLAMTYSDEASEWDDLLTSAGWYGKRGAALICRWDDCKTFHPPWFEKKWPLPSGCTIQPWKKNPQDESLNSLGLFKDDQAVGWIETLRLDPDTIYYFKLSIDYPHRFTGASIALLAESIRRQQASTIPHSVFMINFGLVKPRWIRFIRRRLVPFATKTTEYSQAVKIL